ncbi:hypothetical protein KCU62_g7914, partial [Aureobasidium sp. EXF-3399]
MDDPAFMLLQLQENLRFVHPGARVLSCMVSDENRAPYWTYVILTYDPRGNVQTYLDPYDCRTAKWTNQPLEALKKMHLEIAAQVTDKLIIDNHHPLRQLEEQRLDEAAERTASSASNNHTGSRRGPQQPMAPISASRQTSEHLRSQNSDNPPAYQSQETSSAYVQRSGRLSTRDTLDSIDRVSSSRSRKIEGFDGSGRAGSPVHLPLVTSPTELLFPDPKEKGSPGTTPAGEGWRQQTAVTGTRDYLRSTHSQPRTSGSNMRASNHEKAKTDSQVSRINALPRSRVQQSQPLNPRAATFGNAPVGPSTQPPVQNDKIPISRPTNDYSTAQGVHGMQALHPSTTINPLHRRQRQEPLPQLLSSRPPYQGASEVDLQLPPSVLDLMYTDLEEFLRQVEIHKREQFGPHDILAPIGDSASEFARDIDADLDDGVVSGGGVVSLVARIRDYRPQSPRGSISSGETVKASDTLHRRRRVTQRRYGENETGDPLPPAAPSPPPNDVYPAGLPVYPPTLVNSVSGASVRRNASSAARMNAADRISSMSATQSIRRPTPLGPRSVSSVSRQGTFDERHDNNENERLLGGEERGGSRRVSQNHEEGNQDAGPTHRSHTQPSSTLQAYSYALQYRTSPAFGASPPFRPSHLFRRYDRPFNVRDYS